MAFSTSVVKAKLTRLEPTIHGPGKNIGKPIEFQFNPKEYTVKKGAKWEAKASKGAKKSPMPEFNGSDPQTLSIECFLDATDAPHNDITKIVQELFDCCTPHPETLVHNKPSPPFVLFTWGESFSVTACVKSVSVKYTLFRPNGKPTRATAMIELQEVPSNPAKQNPTSGGLAVRATHLVVAGDSLQSIAHQEYGDPGRWRAIALTNRITDPLRLVDGTSLLLPTADEAAELS